jgi:hypothetical protein
MTTRREFEVLRTMTFSAYDLQMIRMQMGLRLTANFRNKLKREEGDDDLTEEEQEEFEQEKEELLSEKAIKLIDELKESYRRLTDGVARNRRLPKSQGFIGDALVSEFTELVLVDQYIQIEKNEKLQFRQLEDVLEPIPVYQNWLRDQSGIGPAMAAVLLSYFDPEKAPHVSNFWSYAGLDVANTEFFITNIQKDKAEQELVRLSLIAPNQNLAIGEPVIEGASAAELKASGMVGIYRIIGRGRSRRAEHLIDREYTKKDGTTAIRKSVTYNPWLKSRLLGAMGTSFLRTPNCNWRDYYDNYRHRIMSDPNRIKITSETYKKAYKALNENEPYQLTKIISGWDDKKAITTEADITIHHISEVWPPLRIHRAAIRYMVKQFLIWFWVEWRKAEGLPITLTYAEAKLGIRHSGPTPFDGLGLRPDERPTP